MPIVILDTETTGHLGEKKASVIEVGAVCFTEDGHEIGCFSALVKPTAELGSWAQPALLVNKISPDLLTQAPEPDLVWDAMLAWMGLHKPVQEVLAFNVGFDRGMMIRTFPASAHLPWGSCIMRAASEVIRGNRMSIKLEDAVTQLGVEMPPGGAHRAMFDARVAALVWLAVQQRRRQTT